MNSITFADIGLRQEIIDGIEAMNIKHPTPIQAQAIPAALEGKDVIGIAQTGTGKTAAFVLPVMNHIIQHPVESARVRALIVVPTRELATQIDQAIEAYSYFSGVSSMPIYGGGDGADFTRERKAFESGVDIIIATPGRLLSHMSLGYVDFSQTDFLVLDEADRMLNMGFYPDIMRIVNTMNKQRQNLLFSATMPDDVYRLAKQLMHSPITVNIALSKPAEGVKQGAFVVFQEQKAPLIEHILGDTTGRSIIIFSSTKQNVTKLFHQLSRKRKNVGYISSDLEQAEREKVMMDFRNRIVEVLVATDVVSRGIDIDGIDMVVNYDVPVDAEDYVHRVGRTARASKKGEAYTLIAREDQNKFSRIERLIGNEIEKIPVPSELGPTPEYQPLARSSNGGNNRGGKGKFFSKNRGKRPPQKGGGAKS